MKTKRACLLSPAGSPAALIKAAAFGADAVYLGLDKFNARMKADNFTTDNIRYWVDYAHLFGIKVYVTLNTMIKESELKQAQELAHIIFDCGADGIILTDIGLLGYCAKHFYGIELYASTQLSVMNSKGALAAMKLGATGVVLARECKMPDIQAICQIKEIDSEAFIHGAMCVSQSGGCYMSSMADGQSGNRGLCAQPCRKKYQAFFRNEKVNEGYLLSMKDLCGVRVLDQLVEAGVKTFKIEGRNRRAEYAAQAIKAYRKAIAGADLRNDIIDLKKLFNRGDYTDGYAVEDNNGAFIYASLPGHCGVKAGKIIAVFEKRIKVELFFDVSKGDAFKIISGQKEVGNALSQSSYKKGEAFLVFNGKANAGDYVYITTDKALTERLNSVIPSLSVAARFEAKSGCKPILKLTCGQAVVTETGGFICEQPLKAPITQQDIKKCICKTGNTVFKIDSIDISIDSVFFPISALNELRRKAFDTLSRRILQIYETTRKTRALKQPCNNACISIQKPQNRIICVSDTTDFSEINNTIKDIVVYRPWDFKKIGLPKALSRCVDVWYLDLPSVAGEADLAVFEKWFAIEGFGGIVANNLYALQLGLEKGFDIIGGLGLNISNSLTVKELEAFGVDKFIYSAELTIKECENIGGGYIFAQGEIYNMHLSHCPYKVALRCECAQCPAEKGSLIYKDELGNKFTIKRRRAARCYFDVINSAVLKHSIAEDKSGVYINYSRDSMIADKYTKGRLIKGVK